MLNVERIVHITLYLLVILSSLILGMSLESPRLIVIALAGATIGFVVTDVMKLFRIEGLIANMTSIVILILAMKDFLPEDSTGKLVSVANLLVYLQTVLMFQEKTPRLNWQIIVLSLLQVVVGAIFSLRLEAGMLFFVYFFVVGMAMLLQSVYSVAVDIKRRNQKSAGRLFPQFATAMPAFIPPATRQPEAGFSGNDESRRSELPVMFFDVSDNDRVEKVAIFTQLVLWLGVSLVFASIMFYLVPRHTDPWFGPMSVEVKSAGVSKSVDLDERGVIPQSTQLMFRCKFRDEDQEDEKTRYRGMPYFRGLALSDLVIVNDQTDWRAPHDRVHTTLYQRVPPQPQFGTAVVQTITLEETADPLIYGVVPFFRNPDTPKELSFCHEISALTRCKINEKIGMAPYQYEAQTLVNPNGDFYQSWPYVSNTREYSVKPMSDDPPQHAWLTKIDSSRYTAVATLSDQIASQNQAASGTRLDLFNEMESYFKDPRRFRYTLDFRKVKRDTRIEPIEDFVRNHRSGHCELFASALTLMLRHQNIPARVVVGFRGGDYSQMTGTYLVRAKHAHAWVEAYLRPEDCTPEMMRRGEAGPGGAWMILDATPGSGGSLGDGSGDIAIDLARSVWDDYVLGMEGKQSGGGAFSFPIFAFLRNLDVDQIEEQYNAAKKSAGSPLFKYGFGGLMLVVMLFWIRKRWQTVARPEVNVDAGRMRRIVATAISLISPGLGQWVLDGSRSASPTEFYQRLIEILEKKELIREPSQTHREFAVEVASRFKEHPSANMIQSTVKEVTELFNEVRFGKLELEAELAEQIDLSLSELNILLGQSAAGAS